MNIFHTPYPRANWVRFSGVLFLISLSVSFILIVFQPFGTAAFDHPHKMMILAGYGLVIFLSGVSFFALSEGLITEKMKDRWSVGMEVVFLLITLIICQLSCFIYYTWLFDISFTVKAFFYFLIIASSVSVLPVGFYLLIIYLKYRDVHYAFSLSEHTPVAAPEKDITSSVSSQGKSEAVVTITGSGKSEKYVFQIDSLRLIQAEDNYVILHTSEENSLKKWMIRATMNDVEAQLPSCFMRIHRSYIVHTDFIQKVVGNAAQTRVVVESIPDDIPVSRSRVSEVRLLDPS